LLVEISKADCAHIIAKTTGRLAQAAQQLSVKDVQNNRPKEFAVIEALEREAANLQKLVAQYRAGVMEVFHAPLPPLEMEEPVKMEPVPVRLPWGGYEDEKPEDVIEL
jgi:hypothetical protein